MRLFIDSWRDLRAHPGKTVLTAISLFIAVMAIVGVSTAGALSRDAIIAKDEQQSGRDVTIEATFPQFKIGAVEFDAVRRALRHRVADQLGGDWAMIVDTDSSVMITAGTSQATAIRSVRLVAGRLDRILRLPLVHGRYLAADEPVYPGAAVINEAAETALATVGDRLSMRIDPYRPALSLAVVGVIDDGDSAPMVYGSLASWVHFDPTLAGATSLHIDIHASRVPETMHRSAMSTAATDAGLPADSIVSRRDRGGEEQLSLSSAQQAFLAVSLIMVLVAVVGMTNIGLASIRERSRELSVRRAIGFTSRRIFGLVLSSSLLIGMLVALLAVAVAFGVVVVVLPDVIGNRLIHVPRFPWGTATLALATGFVSALVGGIAPAIAAARTDIAPALR
jgi:MacB-like periplasmic core domain/FtsX-like permease family